MRALGWGSAGRRVWGGESARGLLCWRGVSAGWVLRAVSRAGLLCWCGVRLRLRGVLRAGSRTGLRGLGLWLDGGGSRVAERHPDERTGCVAGMALRGRLRCRPAARGRASCCGGRVSRRGERWAARPRCGREVSGRGGTAGQASRCGESLRRSRIRCPARVAGAPARMVLGQWEDSVSRGRRLVRAPGRTRRIADKTTDSGPSGKAIGFPEATGPGGLIRRPEINPRRG